ncbi:terminal nucleotidyltransferase 5C-like [Fundulus diaphanus]
MEHKTEKRFHNLTHEQVQALDKVLTEVIPIHGRGNFPTLQVRAKDIIRVVKDRLVERDIQVKDIRLNGATASHVLVRDNGLGYRDLDIIFGVELPRQEDFQVIKEVVLGSLRDLLPCGVNRRKITCLTMKEAYVQKMVKVFNEHDRWSLILLSNNRSKTVGLRFVSSLRRQFEFSVDSFQIILDRMLESYWENDRREEGKLALNARYSSKGANGKENNKTEEQSSSPQDVDEEDAEKDGATNADPPRPEEAVSAFELPDKESEGAEGKHEVKGAEGNGLQQVEEDIDGGGSVHPEAFELCEERAEQKQRFTGDYPSEAPPKTLFPDARDPLMTRSCLKLQATEEVPPTNTEKPISQEIASFEASTTLEANIKNIKTENTPTLQDSRCEYSFPPPAKKTCSTSQDIVPDYCPSPKLQRKMSRKLISQPEKWSLLTDVSDLTTQLFPPIEIVKPLQPKPAVLDSIEICGSNVLCPESEHSKGKDAPTVLPYSPEQTPQTGAGSCEPAEQTVKPKHSKKPPDLKTQTSPTLTPQVNDQGPELLGPVPESPSISAQGEPVIAVEAECMYGDFEQAMDHLRHRLIATHNPEEIRGGGLLKYSDLLVRNFRPASETEIKSLERYMCSRFFIDFPDVGEQQRKIEAYLQCHFVGNEEASKYDYLMTLRRVIDESTVCLMGHERRQTLNMITVLALRVLGEQNAIPNTANVTCFYQPAPYVTEPIYNSYYIPQAQPPLVYHPYPLHVHMQSGLV